MDKAFCLLIIVALTMPAALNNASAAEDVVVQDQEPGKRFFIKPDALPPPYATDSVENSPQTIPISGDAPKAPPGFSVNAFATDINDPRRLLVLPDGDVVVAQQEPGYVSVLRDEDGDGKADRSEQLAGGFDNPYGLAWRPGEILVADQLGIWRVPHAASATRMAHERQSAGSATRALDEAAAGKPGKQLLTKSGVFGAANGHQNRGVAIDPKSGALYVGVGSMSNIGEEPPVKASIQIFDADGSNQRLFASGLRNATSLAFQPGSGTLFAVVEERDGMGDRLVPDYLTHVRDGGFYGWPYAYIGKHPQPGFADKAPEKVAESITPDVLFEAHSSALDLVFYEADQFPATYKGDVFVALRGSWNRAHPTGYKVVRVPFENGKPKGWYENFLTGFWVSGTDRAKVWGRPTALAVAKDGSLLVADDTGGTIWRISYAQKR